MCKFNTDMADERVDEYKTTNNLSSIDGIEVTQREYEEFKITEVNVLNENGKKSIDKEIGKYITIDVEEIKYIENEKLLIKKINEELEKMIEKDMSILVVGLGNMYVTPDALGSKVTKGIEVTRHLLKFGKELGYKNVREVSCITPGVMGNTGIETSEIVYAISNIIKPDIIIAIDSLMSKSITRIGSSIQISDTGITPGSGINGVNSSIDNNSTNAKVISIGVPMVVDVKTIINEVDKDNNLNVDELNYIVTPKDIDDLIEVTSRIISKSINELSY